MTITSELNLVTRDPRTNNADKRKRRYVDESIRRQEKLAFKAKRNFDLDMEDEDDTL